MRVSSDDSFRLQGEIAGQQDQLFKMLVDYTVKANPVVIDFAHVHRIDFVNAGRLAGVLEKAGQSGKAIVVRGAGEMTIALFAVVGLHQHARRRQQLRAVTDRRDRLVGLREVADDLQHLLV